MIGRHLKIAVTINIDNSAGVDVETELTEKMVRLFKPHFDGGGLG